MNFVSVVHKNSRIKIFFFLYFLQKLYNYTLFVKIYDPFKFIFKWYEAGINDYIFYILLVNCSEKAMTTHSSTLVWKIPWMEEPGRLQSMGSQRVGLDWATSLSLFTFMHCRRKWQAIPVSLPGESQGRGRLVGCHLWGCTESDTTEVT